MDLESEICSTGPLTPRRLLEEPGAVVLDVLRVGGGLVLVFAAIFTAGGALHAAWIQDVNSLLVSLAVAAAVGCLVLAAVLLVLGFVGLMYLAVWPFRRWILPLKQSLKAKAKGLRVAGRWSLADPEIDF
ncbi:MAG: hypothetical protein U0835_12905 [Isosphaeraceae bacterium]